MRHSFVGRPTLASDERETTSARSPLPHLLTRTMNGVRSRVNRTSKNENHEFQKVFVVGCPRSGTTWVQLLLAEHDEVVTAPETHIFSFYLNRLRQHWEREHKRRGVSDQGKAGLSRLLSQVQFDDLCRSVALTVLNQISAKDPGAATVVEKSPQHATHVRWISSLFPDAHVVHVVRDPRDAVSSILSASVSWGKDWAPRHPIEAARMWKSHVAQARQGRDAATRYSEVRYEDLKRDPVGQVDRLYRRLGLEASRSECRMAVESCRLERLQQDGQKSDRPVPGEHSPDGFFRKGQTGGWRDDLSSSTVRLVEFICRDPMVGLGYEPTLTGSTLPRARVRVHDGLQRVREAVDWQLERLSHWV